MVGFEPTRLSAADFESATSADSATLPLLFQRIHQLHLNAFGLATLSNARSLTASGTDGVDFRGGLIDNPHYKRKPLVNILVTPFIDFKLPVLDLNQRPTV